MKVFDTLIDLPESARHAVIAIGNFDGVHTGHQELLSYAREIARKENRPFGLLTFEPHPRKLFRSDDPPFRITPFTVKQRQLESCDVDYLFSLDFDWDFASQSPEQFIETVLTNGLQPTHIVVGYDFHFGQLRKGTTETLKAAGEAAGFKVTVIDKIADEGDAAISSSAIRQALRHGEIERAHHLLGWEWEIEGIVQKGDQRGREIGYPTANVPLGDTIHPGYGVYATWVKIIEDGPDAPWLPSATNIGIRPMFELKVGQVETYIFDFDRDIYGKTLRIKPIKRLRGEAKFDSLDDLIKQIERDCILARSILNKD